MKKLFLLGVFILMWFAVISQIPQTFNYQGIVRDNTGNIVANQSISVKISIAPEGTYVIPVYSETHNVTTNQFGLFTLKVGEGTPLEGDFQSIRWWEGTYLLQSAVDITGGNNYQEMGATQIVSVPFSLYSKGLILTDGNGQSYVVTVDEQGNLSTNQLYTKCGDNFTDPRDGHSYGTTQIGNQCWMTSNLVYGTTINSSTAQSDNGVIEHYCYDDNPYACLFGGGLYTWDEMMNYSTDSINQGICPDGWRIPTDYEWKILEGVADGQYGVGDPVWNQTGWRGTDAGGNLKSTNSNFWNSPNTGATDKFGMHIAGSAFYDGSAFTGAAENAYIYTSVETGTGVVIRKLSYDNAAVFRGDIPKTYAASVRCISNRSYPNEPPAQPSDPSPADGSTEQSNSSILSWQCSDPENESITYDVFFGTNNPPALVSAGQGSNTYDPGQLQPGSTYYWKIIAYDYTNSTEGTVWSFTTTTNLPPNPPVNPAPPDQAQELDPFDLTLSWSCSDPNNDVLSYDVYLGQDNPTELIAIDISDTSINVSPLEFGMQYYWKVVAKDALNETESEVWSFSTLMNMAPEPPSSPVPSDGGGLAWGSDTLRWSCFDPDNDSLTYDVLFGDDQYNLNFIASGIQDTAVTVAGLYPGNIYYWQVIARDQYFETWGYVWSFMALYPPVGKPYNPGPANNATDVSVLTGLSWQDTVYADNYSYSVYFGTTTPPELDTVFDGGSQVNLALGQQLQPNMMYYWQILVTDYYGNTNMSDLWRFTTTGNTPPGQPSNPQPGNNAMNVAIDDTLFWSCTDPQNDPLTYDVYFGTDQNNLPLVSSSQTDTAYVPGTLSNGTDYYWKIVAKDNLYETEGVIWHFISGNNTPPNAPVNPVPADNSVNLSIYDVTLSWECTDPDGNPLAYDLYFGTSNPPSFYESNLTDTAYDLGELTIGTQYYWKVESHDNYAYTSSAVWTFTTSSDNPPNIPINPQPLDNSYDQPVNTTLSWQCSDPDTDPLTYDVYLGSDPGNMALVSADQSGTTYDPDTLYYSTPYYWKIVASDSFYETEGNVWFFNTIDNLPPDPPANPVPSDGATGVSTTQILSWTCSDPENDQIFYNVYFGTDQENLQLMSSGQNGTTYDPGTLSTNTQYFWFIESFDQVSNEPMPGNIWSFTTGN